MITNTTIMEAMEAMEAIMEAMEATNWSAIINRLLQYNLLGVVTNSNYINYPRYVCQLG